MDELFYHNDEPIFSTDIEKIKKMNDEERKARLLRWKNDFVDTLCITPHGRRVLWFLIFETYVFRKYGQYNAGAYAMEGKRELGQDIIDVIGPEKLLESLIKTRNEELERQASEKTKKEK
jgi:hypothetical protein